MKELIELITKALVNNPDQVKISEIHGDNTSIIELSVAKEDVGQIIGRQGRTADALRTILNATAKKTGKRTVLEIVD